MYLHFVFLFHIDMAHVVENLSREIQGTTYSVWTISWLLMSCSLRRQDISNNDIHYVG